MIPVSVMGLRKYFLNTDPILKSKFAVRCKPGYRPGASVGKESPDSTEQCTPITSGVL